MAVITADKIESATYSTTEKAVGTWIDGKILYRKSILRTFVTGVSDITTPHGIPIDTPVRMEGSVGGSPLTMYANSGFFRITSFSSAVVRVEQSGNSLPSGPSYISLFYTKV